MIFFYYFPFDILSNIHYSYTMNTYDCIIIGAGPAGLSAAIYMARFNRSVLIVDEGGGRAAGPQHNENYLGFPNGIKASRLLELGTKQAKKFGVSFAKDRVETIEKKSGVFHIKGDKENFKAKTVILCPGVKDLYPSFHGYESYIGKSLFWCIICDGYKTRNKRVLIVGHADKAVTTCLQFLSFTDKLVFLTNLEEGDDELTKDAVKKLEELKIPIYHGSIKEVVGARGKMKKVLLDNGQEIATDFMFNKQGYVPRSKLGVELGAIVEGDGFIKVDKEMKTSVERLYAAGDVTSASAHQIVTAAHQGSIAATSANEDLLADWQK
jgi:thioredoxin reductase (NADPH)